MNLRQPLLLSAAIAGFLTLPAWSEEDHDHGGGKVELGVGHSDVQVTYEDDKLGIHIHDQIEDVEIAPDDLIILLPEAAEAAVPANTDFAFLGSIGDPLWILPQNAIPNVLFLGIAADNLESGIFLDDTTRVELVSIEGPGHFFAYDTDAFGAPNVQINSADGITGDDRLTVAAGAHFHVDMTFNAEGDYKLTFVVKAALPDGAPVESEPITLNFEVGHHDDDGHDGHGHGELEAGHADIEVAYEEGELELHIHDEDTDMELEPGEVVLAVPEAAESAVPDGANFAFLGNVGDPLWILPQTAQSDVLFLGIAAGEVESGVFMNDTTYVELVSVDGPGNFFVYNTDSFGAPSVSINSADGITSDDSLTVLAGSHGHVNWTFDAEGDYEVAFVVKGTLLDGTSIESEPTTLNFEVGHHDDDGHDGHGHGELEAGHADIEVAYEEGKLELHIHDEDTDMELEPGEVVLAVPEAAESAVPDGANFAFLGNVGDPLWILPQTAQSDVLFLGIAAGEVESGVFMNDTTYVELVSVDGPGNFFVYNTDSFGVPSVSIDSADGITSDDSLTVLAGSHGHVNWTFDAEGDYELTFVVKGTLLDSTSVESEPTTLNFEVGHHDDDGHETFEQWTLDNFGANPGDEASVDGNPDLDDLNNVLEFAFGTDPNTPDSTELVVTDAQTLTTGTPVLSTLTVGDGVNFTVRFVRRMDAESAGLTYNIQFSRDMSEWETTDQAPIMVATQGDYEVVEVDFPFAMSNGRKPQFFRVLAELSN